MKDIKVNGFMNNSDIKLVIFWLQPDVNKIERTMTTSHSYHYMAIYVIWEPKRSALNTDIDLEILLSEYALGNSTFSEQL